MPDIKKEQALTEHKPSEIGKTNLEIALKSNLIKNDPEGVGKTLRYVMVLIGIRANNLPDELEKTVLINFIQSNYGGHTIAEIRLAFELAINGQLDIEDVKCYENFSVLYFASIMNSYRRWSAQEFKQVVKSDPPEQVLLTDEQLENIHRQDIENFYQRCLAGRVPEKTPDYFKAILVKDGLMKQEDNLVAFFVNRLNNNSKNIYVKED